MIAPIYGQVPLIVLTPLIPAYILFRTLKTTAEVSGKEFFGFQVQLGGAFAGYFVILLLLLHSFSGEIHPQDTEMVYHLKGQVVDDQDRGVALTPDSFALSSTSVLPRLSPTKDGQFDYSFIVSPGGSNYPTVEVSYGDFLPADIVLDPNNPDAMSDLKWNAEDHTIYLKKKIPLRRAADSQVHVSEAQPVNGVAAEYQNLKPANPVARPSGYGAGG